LIPLIRNKLNYNKKDDYILINTGTIGKYNNRWGQKEITYLGKKILYPVVNKKLFVDTFGKSYSKRAGMPKLIIKGLNLLDACFDFTGQIIPGKTTLVICNDDIDLLKILCCIINSKLIKFYIKNKYSSSSYNGGITFTKDMINNIPIPPKSASTGLIQAVDRIITAKAADQLADRNAEEAQINKIVYKLYGLTEEEIKEIEGKT
jgi:hypothetical protein